VICPQTIAIGAYVLGALDASERLETDRHIRDCAHCRDALLQFAHLPGLLNALTLEEVTSVAPDVVFSPTDYDLGLDLLTPRISRDGRDLSIDPFELPVNSPPKPRRLPRSHAVIAAAAAATLLFAGGLIGRQLITDSAPQALNSSTWSATHGAGRVHTTAQMTSQPWGTDIRLHMTDLPAGAVCKLVVHARNGASETTGWWSTNGDLEADVPASTSIPLADIDRVQVTTTDSKILSTLTESTR
jgi:hypothetical protein